MACPTEIMKKRIESAKSILDLVFSCQCDEVRGNLMSYDTIPANMELAATLMQNENMDFFELLRLTGWSGKLLYHPFVVDSEIDNSNRSLIESLWYFIAQQFSGVAENFYIVPLQFKEEAFLSWRIAEINDEILPYRFKDHKRYTQIVILSPKSYALQKRKYASFVRTYKLDSEIWRALQIHIVKCETPIRIESAYFGSNTQVDITVNDKTNVEVIGKSRVYVRLVEKTISAYTLQSLPFYFIQDVTKGDRLPF